MKAIAQAPMRKLRIYGPYKSRASRVYWAADELGVAFESIPVSLAHSHPQAGRDAGMTTRSPEFLAVNPSGLVPVIDDDGLILRESLAITYYLARKHGDALAPATQEEEAAMLSWTLWVATEIEPLAVQILVALEHGETPPDRAAIGRIADKLKAPFTTLDDHLADRDYVVGGRFTIVDINIAEVLRLSQGERALFEPFPNIRAWLRRCQDRPAFARMMAGRKREEDQMKGYEA